MAVGEEGVMKNFSERVSEPPERVWTVRVGLAAIAFVYGVLAM